MNYRIGYIGFGGMAGGYHYDTAMREDVPFTPTAVYDVNPDRRAYAESKGLKAFDNIGDFLASRIFDIVLVATPNQFHCPYVCAALEAGYHAMSEKPAAMTSAEGLYGPPQPPFRQRLSDREGSSAKGLLRRSHHSREPDPCKIRRQRAYVWLARICGSRRWNARRLGCAYAGSDAIPL